jgi:hypothetical protein
MLLKSEELDDVAGTAKPEPMTCEGVMDVLKGNRFRFSLDNGHYKEYLIESRKIAEKILKRSVVNIERGLQTIQEHFVEVSDPQYRSVFLMRLYQVALEQAKPREAAELTKLLF